ncbi:MAG TPA: hypothetical protein VE377_23670 [Candidatus Dormibacteraeota bacterium]|nr:hypothetical protein [Candidatus Dormibacteraeota bacterium]
MKAWSAALAAEMRDWPQLSQKVFFGFTALYRGRNMFGMLPRTRSILKGNAVAFRLDGANQATRARLEKDPRIDAFDKDKTRWFTFELSRDEDLHDALDWLAAAYQRAGNPRKST